MCVCVFCVFGFGFLVGGVDVKGTGLNMYRTEVLKYHSYITSTLSSGDFR